MGQRVNQAPRPWLTVVQPGDGLTEKKVYNFKNNLDFFFRERKSGGWPEVRNERNGGMKAPRESSCIRIFDIQTFDQLFERGFFISQI